MLEIIRSYGYVPQPRVAIFDFDGTLSLIRSGWMPLMVSQFTTEILALGTGEKQTDIEHQVREIVLALTGKETIHQIVALTEELRKRGGNHKSPVEFREDFLRELGRIMNARKIALLNGELQPDDLLVPGARPTLNWLDAEGIELYLASGTDDESVKQEAEMLDLTRYFGSRIFGARDDAKGFTKAALVAHLVERGVKPGELVGFGDGFVEIHEVSKAGGLALGLATDEPECLRVDEGKRRSLIAAGAHAVIPNLLDDDWKELLFPTAQRVTASTSHE